MPILGYNVVQTKLVVEDGEAERVRQIFQMYLDLQSLLPVVKELERRRSLTKQWTTHKGVVRGGRPFDKHALYQLLTNVAYIGQVRYKDEVHAGEHHAIVDVDVFARVQALLQRNGRSGGRAVRNKQGALLRGLLRCGACKCGMNHAYSAKDGCQYRYYVCYRAQQHGWQACPAPSIPAGEIERFVVNEIKAVGRDPLVIKETLAQTRRQAEDQIERLKAERTGLLARLRHDHVELGRRAAASSPGDPGLIDAHDRIHDAERRVTEIDDELAALNGNLVDEAEVAAALGDFDGVWDCLAPREQARIIDLLVEQITYDGKDGNISITFRPTGIRTLAGELGNRKEEAA
jgi:site-specific DNA recombinase